MELWDIYDKDRNLLPYTRQRGETLEANEFHLVVGIWIVNSKGEILLTLRDPRKPLYPDKWESTGGSVVTGETSRHAAARELKEETGIVVAEDELLLLFSERTETNSIKDIYFLHRDVDISQLTMQEGETVAAQWVTLETLKTMMDNGDVIAPVVQQFYRFEKEFFAAYNKVIN